MIEAVLPSENADNLMKLLLDHDTLGVWSVDQEDHTTVVRILTRKEHTETITDLMAERYSTVRDFRMMLFSVEATFPKPEEPSKKETECAEKPEVKVTHRRISREELCSNVEEGIGVSWIFLVTVILSTLVASIGLLRGDVAIIIGAMVIAPLLKPNVALALGATLGDTKMVWKALKTAVVGTLLVVAVSAGLGYFFGVDFEEPEILSRTVLSPGHIVLALAAGCAGTLAYTTAMPSALIGVMVAVALLPPLAVCGLTLGAGDMAKAMGAFLLFIANLTCINLAGVVTFIAEGIQPRTWWEKEKARKATTTAILIWAVVLALLALIIVLRWGR